MDFETEGTIVVFQLQPFIRWNPVIEESTHILGVIPVIIAIIILAWFTRAPNKKEKEKEIQRAELHESINRRGDG